MRGRGFYLFLGISILLLSATVEAVTFYVPVTVTVNSPGDLEGDVDDDCDVDIFDLAAVGLDYGSQVGTSGLNGNTDVYPHPYGDGIVNIFDLATVGLNYGNMC